MILKQLSLTNFKNIEAATLQFSDKLNCIIGANGMGKTNLLESIYYLSFTRTNQYLPESMLILHGAEVAVVDGEYEMYDKREQLYIGIKLGKSKVLKRNKKEYSKMSDHIGIFPLVMIAPSDIDLIRGGSLERRNFMDQIICQEYRPYLTAAQSYKSLLEQRNAMLKNSFGLDLSLLEILNHQMAEQAESIMKYRKEWLERITPIFLKYYHFISDSNDAVSLHYLPSFEALDGYSKEDFINVWEASLQKDLALGYTSLGPHRDDLEMLIGDVLIRKIGSQGQNKSFMIALKLAQYELLRNLHPNNYPILLLDDVFDKLDEKRVERIVQLVSGADFGQIFMTDTNRKYLDQILQRIDQDAYSIFYAQDGSFETLTEE